MFSRHPGVLSLFMLLLVAGVALGSAWAISSRTVDPTTASRPQLLRALALRDLTAAPLALQQAWVNRLQTELAHDSELGPEAGQLSAGYRRTLANNVAMLQEVWFHTRVEEYAALPADQRPQFLREQITTIGTWSKMAALVQPNDDASAADASLSLIGQIDGWLASAQGEQREQMAQAVRAGTLYWLTACDLTEYSPALRRELALRCAAALDCGDAPDLQSIAADSAATKRLTHNAGLLVEAYVHELAAQFAALPANERSQFIDEQLAAIERWRVAELLAKVESSADSSTQLARHMPTWIEHAPPGKRQEVSTFVLAVQTRILWKRLPAWLQKS